MPAAQNRGGRHKKKEDFTEVEKLAYEMGLRPLEFYQVSPREFSLMLDGYRAKRLDEYKLNRNIMYIMVKLWSSKPINSPSELWDLGDEEGPAKSDDELAKLFEALKEKQKNG